MLSFNIEIYSFQTTKEFLSHKLLLGQGQMHWRMSDNLKRNLGVSDTFLSVFVNIIVDSWLTTTFKRQNTEVSSKNSIKMQFIFRAFV
jgi:hypothetical protein